MGAVGRGDGVAGNGVVRVDAGSSLNTALERVLVCRPQVDLISHSWLIAPERSGGASYSESGVSNDQVFVRCPSDVRPEKTGKTPNGIWPCQEARYHSGYFSVDFQGAEENCVLRRKE